MNGAAVSKEFEAPPTSAADDMAAFDALPPPVRAALREAPFDFSSVDVLETMLAFRQPVKAVVEQIRFISADALAEAYRKRGLRP